MDNQDIGVQIFIVMIQLETPKGIKEEKCPFGKKSYR